MYIAQINSTNDYLQQHPEVDWVRTDFQTAGRGQLGNTWESERGANVLLSLRLLHQNRPAIEQWQVCEMVSIALWKTVSKYIDDPVRLCIKWPNDLYYKDQKIAGMLIEHTLCGTNIVTSIVGIGLNVNQLTWIGSAPNPTSIRKITGKVNNVEAIANQLVANLRNIGVTSANYAALYRQYLYRKGGIFWWEEREVSTQPTMNGRKTDCSFEAEIIDITPMGELVLRKRNGEEKTYHFKQIKYIL